MKHALLALIILMVIGCSSQEEPATPETPPRQTRLAVSYSVAQIYTGLYTWDVTVQHFDDAVYDEVPGFNQQIRVAADSGIQAEFRALNIAKQMYPSDVNEGIWMLGPLNRVQPTESE